MKARAGNKEAAEELKRMENTELFEADDEKIKTQEIASLLVGVKKEIFNYVIK
jgi:hypothetical protein